jgi:hypothetical protein
MNKALLMICGGEHHGPFGRKSLGGLGEDGQVAAAVTLRPVPSGRRRPGSRRALGALALPVASEVLVTLSAATVVQPYLPTRFWLAWIDFFRQPIF